MFEPHDSDIEWMKLKKNTVQQWYLFQSYGVHMLVVEGVIIYMLVEKDYPALNFNRDIVHQMIKPCKLRMHKDFWYQDHAYQLLKKYERIIDTKPPKQKKK